ncbi:MAG: PIN domain-containing protein, partial [Thermoproteota archaeon]
MTSVAREGFDTIVYGDFIKKVPPDSEDLDNVYKLNKIGWSDMFDALLYSTAKRIKIPALTLDLAFRSFLKENSL